jgi:rod shape-determining protein MreC
MGNIVAFLARHHRFFIFILLEAICFSLVVNYNKDQSSAFFRAAYDMSGRVDQTFTNVSSYFHLQHVNDSLKAENARLRSKLKTAIYFDTTKAKFFNDTIYHQKYSFIPCDVINNSVTGRNNYLTLDAGTNKNIGKHLGVVTTSGIAGVTRDVSPHFTSVLSVLHKDFTVSAEIAEMKEIGTVVWDGNNPEMVIMKDIPLHIRIRKGMHVVTSPYSELFPQGTPIGVIEDFKIKQADAFYTIYVKLATDIRNIRSVYVVSNLMKVEQEKIEPKPEKK